MCRSFPTDKRDPLKVVALLLDELGTDPNARDNDDNTPLHLASKLGLAKVAEILLDRGVDVDARDKNYKTPLHWLLQDKVVE